jgi:PAS domain-containing protein
VGIPVIMVSGSVGEETAVDLLKKGLCDFVLKDRLQRLVPAIERSLKEREAERARVFNMRLLELVHEHVDMQMLLKEFIKEIKDFTECDAVGIRVLDHEGNIPYQAFDGFSPGFFEVESPLSIKSDKCMCINVINGTADDRLPFYTKHGSFYMNGTSRFLATVSEEEKGETRNVCNAVGFESVALVPFRSEGKILGLIHVADRLENRAPLYLVELLERSVMQLGTAFQRAQAKKALKIQQEKFRNLSQEYRILLDNVPDGIVYLSPDCRIRWANAAANSFFGLNSEADSHGKTCHEAFWNRDESCPDCPVVRS